MRWIALHLPALSLESWAATRTADQAGRPLALLHEHQVQHADALATARGVRPGMGRATALALASDLLLAAADVQRDAHALRAVVHVALGFSPSVTWATPADLRAVGDFKDARPAPSPALVGVRLEVQSCLRYFGGLARLLDRLRAALAPLGHQVRIASAPTALGAALLAAWRDDLALGPPPCGLNLPGPPQRGLNVPGPPQRGLNLPGPPQRGLNVPDPPLCVSAVPSPPPCTPDALRALQPLLDALPLALLDPAQAPVLAGMGLHTLADLRPLPRAGIARRFGTDLLAHIDQARGQAPEAQVWLTLPPCFASRIELLCRADTSAQVLAGAHLLLARLMAWAGARQARVARFTLVMHHEPRRRRHRDDQPAIDHSTLEIAPAEPAADAAHLYSLLAERLGRAPLPEPALDLSLLCDHLVAGTPPNGELFASRASQREGLARLVERLQARLGVQQVQSLAPVADYRPEHGTRWQPADPARLGALPRAGPTLLGAPGVLSTQPLWLLPQPRPLVLRAQGLLLDGRPLQLLAGPERLETGWWDEGLALRDYFIAQAASGALVWVYRNRLQSPAPDGPAGQGDAGSGWFLHGLFA